MVWVWVCFFSRFGFVFVFRVKFRCLGIFQAKFEGSVAGVDALAGCSLSWETANVICHVNGRLMVAKLGSQD